MEQMEELVNGVVGDGSNTMGTATDQVHATLFLCFSQSAHWCVTKVQIPTFNPCRGDVIGREDYSSSSASTSTFNNSSDDILYEEVELCAPVPRRVETVRPEDWSPAVSEW